MPDPMREWIEHRIKDGEYASTSDYLRDLVRRDRERLRHPELTIEQLRQIVLDARQSGLSARSTAEIKSFARAGIDLSGDNRAGDNRAVDNRAGDNRD